MHSANEGVVPDAHASVPSGFTIAMTKLTRDRHVLTKDVNLAKPTAPVSITTAR